MYVSIYTPNAMSLLRQRKMASYGSGSPIPRKIVDLMHGYCASQALFSACELGIFDALYVSCSRLHDYWEKRKMASYGSGSPIPQKRVDLMHGYCEWRK